MKYARRDIENYFAEEDKFLETYQKMKSVVIREGIDVAEQKGIMEIFLNSHGNSRQDRLRKIKEDVLERIESERKSGLEKELLNILRDFN